MPDLIVTTKFAIGDKAITAIETSSRMMYNIVKIVAIKNVVPDVDDLGTDIITYTVEYFAPGSVNKLRTDLLESELVEVDRFKADYDSF